MLKVLGGKGTYEAGKGEFEEKEIGGTLVAADLAERDGTGAVAFGFSRAGDGGWYGGCWRREGRG